MPTPSFKFAVTRPVTRKQQFSLPGYTGFRSVKIGDETVQVELTVDFHKLAKLLGFKLRTSPSMKTTLADGAIVAKVISKSPMVPVDGEAVSA